MTQMLDLIDKIAHMAAHQTLKYYLYCEYASLRPALYRDILVNWTIMNSDELVFRYIVNI